MNMLDGEISEDGAAVALAGGIRVPVPALAASPGQKVVLGIRPEHLSLADSGIPAEVSVVEPTGADTQVFTKCVAGELSAIFRERHDFHPGARIFLAPAPETIHVFDAATGKRL